MIPIDDALPACKKRKIKKIDKRIMNFNPLGFAFELRKVSKENIPQELAISNPESLYVIPPNRVDAPGLYLKTP